MDRALLSLPRLCRSRGRRTHLRMENLEPRQLLALDSSVVFLSSTTSGNAGGVSFRDEDIVAYDGESGTWSKHFDGSDVGLGFFDVSAFHLQDDDSILMSFNILAVVPGIGIVPSSDIVRFVPSSLGDNTAGVFERYFDGSDVGLGITEWIDAIGFNSDDHLVISTGGSFSVPGLSGRDEDLIAFDATSLGSNTSGTFSMYFDGSDVGLNNSFREDVEGTWVDTSNDAIYLTTFRNFSVAGLTGDGDDVFIFTPTSLGSNTSGSFSGFFDGDVTGLGNESIDGIFIELQQNQPPMAENDNIATDEDTAVSGDVLADNGNGPDSDPNGDPLTVVEVNGNAANVGVPFALASGALVTVNPNGTFTYDPNGQFESLAFGDAGTDTFGYTIDDGNGLTDTATVQITIAGVNDNPAAQNDAFTTDEDTATTGDVLADNGNGVDADPDGDPLTVSLVNGAAFTPGIAFALPSGAQLSMNGNGVFAYDPNGAFESLGAGATGAESYTYTIDDGNGGVSTATVSIDVTGINDDPVARDDAFNTDEDSPVSGDVLADNGSGADSDPEGDSLTVSQVNGAPFAPGVAFALPSGAELTVNGSGTFTYDPNGQFEFLGVGDTASDNFAYQIDDGLGGFDTANVVVTISGLADAPIAVDDAYNALGNVGINTPESDGVILGSGADDDGGGTVTVTAVQGNAANVGVATATNATGLGGVAGAVTLAADGSFTYEPPPGFVGVDTFSYEISNSVGTDTATVSVSLSDMVWFVDNSSVGANLGTLSNPFTSTAALNGAQGGAAPNAQAGDSIFVHAGSADYVTGITLQTNQILIGEAAGDSISNITGIALPAFSNALPTTGGNAPVITDAGATAIATATDNTIRGLDVGATGGAGISGSEVGTLLVREVNISGTGGGVNLISTTGAAIDVVLDSLSSTSSSSDGIFLSGVSGDFDVMGSANTITSTGSASAIDITGAAIPNEVELDVTLQSVSDDGGDVGIRISNTTGSFTVTGDGSTTRNASGGTIQNHTLDGVLLLNVQNVELNQVAITDPGQHGVFGSGVSDGSGGASPSFAFRHGSITAQGDIDEENAIDFANGASTNITGSLVIDNSLFQNFHDTGVDVANMTGSVDITVSNSEFDDNDDLNGAEGIAVESAGTAMFSLNLTNNSFENVESDAIAIRVGGSGGAHDIDIIGNTSINGGGPDNFPAGGDILIQLSNNAATTFDIQANEILDLFGDGLVIAGNGSAEGRIGGPNPADGNTFSGTGGDGIRLDMGAGSSAWTILVQNNDIGVDNTGTAGGPFNGIADDGIQVFNRDSTGTLNLTVEDNTIGNTASEGIRIFTDEDTGLGGSNPTTNVRIAGNGFTSVSAEEVFIRTRDTASLCAHIAGNDDTAGGSPGTINLDQGGSSTLEITQADIAALTAANNGAAVTTSGTIGFNNGTCTNPTLPGNAMRAASAASHNLERSPIDTGQLATIVAEAKTRWQATALTSTEQTALDGAEFVVRDLAEAVLGRTFRETVYIDVDAGGSGWFIDATPGDDAEFERSRDSGLLESALHASEIDLLTVVMHELGHVMGREHGAPGTVMQDEISPGTRLEVAVDEVMKLVLI